MSASKRIDGHAHAAAPGPGAALRALGSKVSNRLGAALRSCAPESTCCRKLTLVSLVASDRFTTELDVRGGRPFECQLLTPSNSRTRPGAVVRDPELPLPKQPFAPCSRSSSNTPSSSRDIHGDSSVEEQGGLPRSSTSQNQRRNEPPQPCRSAYRASGSVPWPTADHPNDCLPSVGDLQLMKLLAGLMSVANAIGSEWAAHQRRLTLASFGVLHRRSSSRSRPAPAVPRHLPSALPTVRSPHAVRRP